VDEARAVLERLKRIEALEHEHAEPTLLLCELRELVREAEAWAALEHDARAVAAAQALSRGA
jgi:hypothetical protein